MGIDMIDPLVIRGEQRSYETGAELQRRLFEDFSVGLIKESIIKGEGWFKNLLLNGALSQAYINHIS